MSYICLDNLIKRYGNTIAVDNVSLSINKNEIFGLLGPDGAGKSTVIKMITGLLKPDRGTITIDNKDLNEHHVYLKGLLGVVPQDIAIYEGISAWENVSFFGSLYGLRGKLLRERVEEALQFVELMDKHKDKPKSFSGGMKRRLNIACSIVHRPQIIIMDEPTVGIDTQSRNHILESVKELSHMGTTIIYTSHYIEEVEALCGRIGILDYGHVIACGTKSELIQLIDSDQSISIDTNGVDTATSDELRQLPGIIGVYVNGTDISIDLLNASNSVQDILFILSKNNIRIKNIKFKEPALENVFLSLTGRNMRD